MCRPRGVNVLVDRDRAFDALVELVSESVGQDQGLIGVEPPAPTQMPLRNSGKHHNRTSEDDYRYNQPIDHVAVQQLAPPRYARSHLMLPER